MKKIGPLFCILALSYNLCVLTQELYEKECVNYDNGITSTLRDEILKLQLKSVQERDLLRSVREKELLNTLQEKELKIQTLERDITALQSNNYDDVFIRRVCSVQTAVFAHPVECQLYYNCSYGHEYFWKLEYPVLYRSVFMSECDYPFVFSTETLKCENYTVADCGSRTLHRRKCEYYKLKSPNCERKYACEEKSDGLWPDIVYYEEGWSGLVHYYMICKDGRYIGGHSCAYDKIWLSGGYRFLHDQKCKSEFEIPVEDGGYLPSCNTSKDGNYRFPRTCEGYYRCENGTSTAVKCPLSTSYDYKSKICSPYYNDDCQFVGKK